MRDRGRNGATARTARSRRRSEPVTPGVPARTRAAPATVGYPSDRPRATRSRGRDARETFRRSSVVERAAVNRLVVGSSPTAGATFLHQIGPFRAALDHSRATHSPRLHVTVSGDSQPGPARGGRRRHAAGPRVTWRISLHRDPSAGRVPQQLLGDPRMAPASTSRLAAPWRRSWRRIRGSPARASSAWKCFVSHEPLTASRAQVTKTSPSRAAVVGAFRALTVKMVPQSLDTNRWERNVASDASVSVGAASPWVLTFRFVPHQGRARVQVNVLPRKSGFPRTAGLVGLSGKTRAVKDDIEKARRAGTCRSARRHSGEEVGKDDPQGARADAGRGGHGVTWRS